MIEQLLNEMSSLLDQFVLFLPKLLIAIGIFLVSLLLANVGRRAVKRALLSSKGGADVAVLVSSIVQWSIIGIGVLVALSQVGINVAAILASLGILTFAVGFALQDVSKNFVAGLLIMMQRPFNIGETIEVKGYTGKVHAIDLRATELHALDGRHVLIPNTDVFLNPIVNLTRPTKRRVEISAGVAYETDLRMAHQVATEGIRSVRGLLDDPPPQLAFNAFGETGVDFTLYYWIDTGVTDPLRAKDEGLEAIKVAFATAGLEMPGPTQTVILRTESSD